MINIFCYFFGISGWAAHAKNFVTSLSRHEDIALAGWEPPGPEEVSLPVLRMLENGLRLSESNVGLAIGPIERMTEIIGRKKIAYTVWETTRIPHDKLSCLDQVDEIWIPSTWGKQILVANGVMEGKVRVVPEGVDTTFFRPAERVVQASSNAPFRFLYVGKWEERKGVKDLIRAFREEFNPHENVELILHCYSPSYSRSNPSYEVQKLNTSSHPITVSPDPISHTALRDLYSACDAFVLPTKAEGWGLPIIEAMASALPVIVTDYSAHRDFATPENAFLIRVERIIDVDDPIWFHPRLEYGQWAQPDLNHLKYLMRFVFQNRDEARQMGLNARKAVTEKWTWAHSARTAHHYLSF
jgi:glycosyltransferase involved in cell wall biosynthesis